MLGGSAPVDEGEGADAGFLLALAAAAEEKTRGGADPTRDDEAGGERTGRNDRQTRAELPGDVGRLPETGTEILHGVG